LHCQKTLDQVFGDRKYVEWREINPQASEFWKYRPIFKINSLAEVANVLASAQKYLGLMEFFFVFATDPQLTPRFLASPFYETDVTTNPWAPHVGRYKVVSQVCSSDRIPNNDIPIIAEIAIIQIELDDRQILALKEDSGGSQVVSYLSSTWIDTDTANGQEPSTKLAEQGLRVSYSSKGKAHRVILSSPLEIERKDLDETLNQTDVFSKTSTGFQLKRTKFTGESKRYDTEISNPKYFECSYELVKM
jgi:hypothetical protein